MKRRITGILMTGMLTALLLSGCGAAAEMPAAAAEPVKEETAEEPAKEEAAAQGTEEVQEAGSEEQAGTETENALFAISLPAESEGQYLTIIKDNSISVYDKEAREGGFGGFAFGVAAYREPSDYAGGMDKKVGELKTSDGTVYDIVIEYPSDVQFDYEKYPDGMPENYKRLYEGAEDIVKTLKGKSGESIDFGGGTKGEELYGEVLEKYVKAIDEKWDADRLEKEGMTSMIFVAGAGDNGSAADKMGYAYKDVNCDGVDELLIGDIGDGDWKGTVYDIYTMADRKPVVVVNGWDRNRYYALKDSMIVNEYSGGAMESGYGVYDIEPNTGKLCPQFAGKIDGYENEDKPWFISYDYSDQDEDWTNWENVTEEEYEERQKWVTDYERFDFTPFSEFPGKAK